MKIVILTSRGGQGLISGSEAIKEALLKMAPSYNQHIQVEIVDFFKDNSFVGNMLTELYNFFLRRSLMLNALYIKFLHHYRLDKWTLFYQRPRRGQAKLLEEKNPDAIIITSQYLVSPLAWALKKENSNVVSFVGNLDPGTDCVPLWFSEGIQNHIIPTKECLQAFLSRGFSAEQAIEARLVVRQKFLDAAHLDKKELKKQLGIPTDRFVVLFAGSREGYWGIIPLIKEVLSHTSAHVIAICGKNEDLKNKISKLDPKNCGALGWRDDIHLFMRACDVIVSKPGKQTMKESIVVQTPLVSLCFPAVMEQENGNLEVMNNRKVLLRANKVSDLSTFINNFIDHPEVLQQFELDLKEASLSVDPDLVARKIIEKILRQKGEIA
ncbi:MAG: MGDG synthase family glycosyltransferase [Bacteriovorax sp.]